MRRRDFITTSGKAGLLLGASAAILRPFGPLMPMSSARRFNPPPEFVPNDPAYDSAWAHQLNLPPAWFLEKNSLSALVPQAVIVQLDFAVNGALDDLAPNLLEQYRQNFSGEGVDGTITDGTANAGLM